MFLLSSSPISNDNTTYIQATNLGLIPTDISISLIFSYSIYHEVFFALLQNVLDWICLLCVSMVTIVQAQSSLIWTMMLEFFIIRCNKKLPQIIIASKMSLFCSNINEMKHLLWWFYEVVRELSSFLFNIREWFSSSHHGAGQLQDCQGEGCSLPTQRPPKACGTSIFGDIG